MEALLKELHDNHRRYLELVATALAESAKRRFIPDPAQCRPATLDELAEALK